MKSEIKKLALGKQTIHNLNAKEMDRRLGGKSAVCIPKKAAPKQK